MGKVSLDNLLEQVNFAFQKQANKRSLAWGKKRENVTLSTVSVLNRITLCVVRRPSSGRALVFRERKSPDDGFN